MGIIRRIASLKDIVSKVTRNYFLKEPTFWDLVKCYDVVIMKHCFPASDILENVGGPDPSSPRKSLENYRAIYRLLRDKFDSYPSTVFIIWTIPPRHRLFQPSEGAKDLNAARATEFTNWLKTDFLIEGGRHPNILIWDLRNILMDPNSNYLKYEFESRHDSPDSHPNQEANNAAGSQFAEFTVEAIFNFYGDRSAGMISRIVFLHHSTGLNIFSYPALGVPAWLKKHNSANGTKHVISPLWYPVAGNMPVHYYHSWVNQ